jgi:hypothetical protein
MLADSPFHSSTGFLAKEVQVSGTFRIEVIGFVARHLPVWRERLSDSELQESETILTDRLRSHLNSACRHSPGFDVLQFGTEVPDEAQKGRAIDLAAKPCAVVLRIEGRRYSDFDTILPVECKRLPTPKGKDRDEREYVFSAHSSTGGIQRFKNGHHGKAHQVGAMIGYVQEGALPDWERKVELWIKGLGQSFPQDWSDSDLLTRRGSETNGMIQLDSNHTRKLDCSIRLHHLWVKMERP